MIEAGRVERSPVQIKVADTPYVLFRDAHGRVGALHDRCPHRFAPLSAGKVRPDGRLACPYHGWHFDIHGQGRSPTQPSLTRCDAPALQVVERDGFVWIGNKEASLDELVVNAHGGFHLAGAFTIPFAAPLFVVLDNFSEDEHTPWVHTRLGWNEEDVNTVEFSAENFSDRTEVHYAARQRPNVFMRPFGIEAGDIFHNEWVTRFDPVRTEYAIYMKRPGRDGRIGATMRANIFMVPETSKTTNMHVFVTMRYENAALDAMRSVLDPVAVKLAQREIQDDADFIPIVADTPRSMNGMRLGRYDKPLIQNRKLLSRIYWGEASEPSETTEADGDDSPDEERHLG